MKRAIFLLGLYSALLPFGALADVPGVWEMHFHHAEEQMRKEGRPAARALADVMGATGGVEVGFQLTGPGTCDYTLRGPQSEGDPGPVVAKGSITSDAKEKNRLEEKVALAPKENADGRYRFDALCRMKVVEQTNFGSKETGQVEEVRITRTFGLSSENVYRVTR